MRENVFIVLVFWVIKFSFGLYIFKLINLVFKLKKNVNLVSHPILLG